MVASIQAIDKKDQAPGFDLELPMTMHKNVAAAAARGWFWSSEYNMFLDQDNKPVADEKGNPIQ